MGVLQTHRMVSPCMPRLERCFRCSWDVHSFLMLRSPVSHAQCRRDSLLDDGKEEREREEEKEGGGVVVQGNGVSEV